MVTHDKYGGCAGVIMFFGFLCICILGLPLYLHGCNEYVGGFCDRYVLTNGTTYNNHGSSITRAHIHLPIINETRSCRVLYGIEEKIPADETVEMYYDSLDHFCKKVSYVDKLGIAGFVFLILPVCMMGLLVISWCVEKWTRWVKHTQDPENNYDDKSIIKEIYNAIIDTDFDYSQKTLLEGTVRNLRNLLICIFFAHCSAGLFFGPLFYTIGCDDTIGGFCAIYTKKELTVYSTDREVYGHIYKDNIEKSCKLETTKSYSTMYHRRIDNILSYPINHTETVYYDDGRCYTTAYLSRLSWVGFIFLIPPVIIICCYIIIGIIEWRKVLNYLQHCANGCYVNCSTCCGMLYTRCCYTAYDWTWFWNCSEVNWNLCKLCCNCYNCCDKIFISENNYNNMIEEDNNITETVENDTEAHITEERMIRLNKKNENDISHNNETNSVELSVLNSPSLKDNVSEYSDIEVQI